MIFKEDDKLILRTVKIFDSKYSNFFHVYYDAFDEFKGEFYLYMNTVKRSFISEEYEDIAQNFFEEFENFDLVILKV